MGPKENRTTGPIDVRSPTIRLNPHLKRKTRLHDPSLHDQFVRTGLSRSLELENLYHALSKSSIGS